MAAIKERPLALTGLSDNTTIEVTGEFKKRRSTALANAAKITVIDSPQAQQLAVAAISDLKTLRLGIENTRKQIKEPVLDLGRRIDKTANEAVSEIVADEERLIELAEGYALKIRRQQEEEERKRREEAEAALAEEARLNELAREKAEEAQRLTAAAEAAKGAKAKRLAAEAEKADADSRKLDEAALEKSREADHVASTQVATVAPSVMGASTRPVWDFEVLDVRVLAAARPDLVTITPKRADILKVIGMSNGAKIAGLRIFDKIKLSVR